MTTIALPKVFANNLGDVFVPNGMYVYLYFLYDIVLSDLILSHVILIVLSYLNLSHQK